MNTPVNCVEAISFLSRVLEIPETHTTYLQSGFEASNIRRFLVVGYHVGCAMSRVPDGEKQSAGETRFEEIFAMLRDDIEDEVKHDGPDVMNMCGVIDEIIKHKDLIFKIGRDLPAHLEELHQFYKSSDFLNSEDFFRACVDIKEHHFAGEKLAK